MHSCRPMRKQTCPTLDRRSSGGFTLVELIVAMSLTLILLAIAFNLLDQIYDVSDGAITVADMNQNLRVSLNLISRDLIVAGSEIPLGGINLPGGGTSTLIKRPVPAPCLA